MPMVSHNDSPGAALTCVTYNLRCCLSGGACGDVGQVGTLLQSLSPDVVALQEVDRHCDRTGCRDQAAELAAVLGLDMHFQAALATGGGHYGTALLVPPGSRRCRSALLPGAGASRRTEPRAAIWVTLSTTPPLQVIATHLGLHPRNRGAQIDALLGPDWLGHSECRTPRMLLGDLNLLPASAAYRRLRAEADLEDLAAGPTFPARLPMVRLDYLLASSDLPARQVEVVGGSAARRLSDHRPLVARIELPATSGQ